MKQYSFLQEWLGYVITPLAGGIYGATQSQLLNDKEALNIFRQKLLSDPVLLKKHISFCISSEKKLIREYQKDIEFCKKEAERLAQSNDALDREEAQWFSDTSEYEEKIERCKSRIEDINESYLKKDIDKLVSFLFIYKSQIVSDINKEVANKHKLRTQVLTYGGIVGGGVGYHYAKKAGKLLAKRFKK